MRLDDAGNSSSISHSESLSRMISLDTPSALAGEFPGDSQHSIVQAGPLTSQADLKRYIILTKANGNTYFSCGYPACSHEGVFDSRRQTASHVRRVHLREKPFECTTCGKDFAYRQDANRHVNTMNCGKIHECTVCHKRYARKDYRDKHVKRCLWISKEK
ncbi:hypothetical protein JB92DRAFT_2969839 [Gautieria morchelliformis]|nr:hypothetical protein JB92DRAFT_2969839 [Gautieria morchelliformis]